MPIQLETLPYIVLILVLIFLVQANIMATIQLKNVLQLVLLYLLILNGVFCLLLMLLKNVFLLAQHQ
jgi:hypothetical protein